MNGGGVIDAVRDLGRSAPGAAVGRPLPLKRRHARRISRPDKKDETAAVQGVAGAAHLA
jgi:hypothetical protein